MHYYQFNIGDYASHTRHLSLMEDLAYRRLLDLAYTTEKPLIKDVHSLSRLIGMRDHQSEIEDVLKEFFEEVEEGWIHNRVLKELDDSVGRSSKAKVAASVRWAKVKHAQDMLKQCSGDATSINNNASSIENDATHNTIHKTHNTEHKTQYEDEFERFWKAYPKKVGKPDSAKIWKRLKPPIEDVLKAISWQTESKQWKDGYIPNPSTYLNQGRWQDEPPANVNKVFNMDDFIKERQ